MKSIPSSPLVPLFSLHSSLQVGTFQPTNKRHRFGDDSCLLGVVWMAPRIQRSVQPGTIDACTVMVRNIINLKVTLLMHVSPFTPKAME